jgi:Saxitoxin biosynthesis operon protein SxtJ
MSYAAPPRDRSFGFSLGSIFWAIAILAALRGRAVRAETLAGIGTVLIALGALKPSLLRRPHELWWRFARVLAYVNARILLTILFFGVLVPVGLLRRLAGWDPLARRRDRWAGWSPHPSRYADPKHYSRMF